MNLVLNLVHSCEEPPNSLITMSVTLMYLAVQVKH